VTSMRPLRVALIGLARFGIAEPYAGGMEAHTATLARALQGAGHSVTVFAGPATAPAPDDLHVVPIIDREPDMAGSSRIDNAMVPGRAEDEIDGYRRVLEAIATSDFDVVHNASLHPLPVTQRLNVPVLHALHTPPFPELLDAHEERLRLEDIPSTVSAVSATLAAQWTLIEATVIRNGIDLRAWSPLPVAEKHRTGAVWAGRIVPEKGLHLAIEAANAAGMELTIAGPVMDRRYFSDMVEHRLGGTVRWAGHLPTSKLKVIYSCAEVGLVTPMWDEPFGLVAAEMLACGLPVAGFDRGAIASIVSTDVGRLVKTEDTNALAAAIVEASLLDCRRCRHHATRHLSVDAMAQRYVDLYRRLMAAPTPDHASRWVAESRVDAE